MSAAGARIAVTAMAAMTAMTALAAAGAPARADPEVVELQYVAPPECPSRAAFETEIIERTSSVRFAAPARRVFAITIEAVPDGFHGALVVDRIADKELAAPRCDDLAAALALVTALAIDPTANATVRAPAPRTGARPGAWSFEADLDAMVEAGAGPGALFGAAIEARAAIEGAYAIELAAIAGRDSTVRDDAEARFTWLAARPAACRRWPVSFVAVDACGHAEVGAVRASGAMIVNERDRTRLWLAAGLHGGARYALGSRGFALLQIGASIPLVRDRYIFAPDVAIHETPGVTGWLGVGVGLQFR